MAMGGHLTKAMNNQILTTLAPYIAQQEIFNRLSHSFSPTALPAIQALESPIAGIQMTPNHLARVTGIMPQIIGFTQNTNYKIASELLKELQVSRSLVEQSIGQTIAMNMPEPFIQTLSKNILGFGVTDFETPAFKRFPKDIQEKIKDHLAKKSFESSESVEITVKKTKFRFKAIKKAQKMIQKHPYKTLWNSLSALDSLWSFITKIDKANISPEILASFLMLISTCIYYLELFQKRKDNTPDKVQKKKKRKERQS